MSNKHLRLVDRRSVCGGMVRELRQTLRGIDSGDIVSMAFVAIRRDGAMITRYDCECPIKTLGSVELLKDSLKNEFVRR